MNAKGITKDRWTESGFWEEWSEELSLRLRLCRSARPQGETQRHVNRRTGVCNKNPWLNLNGLLNLSVPWFPHLYIDISLIGLF